MAMASPAVQATAEGYDRQCNAFQANVETRWRKGIDERSLLPLLGDLSGQVVLDVGSGTGRWTRIARQLGASEVYALELSRKMADVARGIEEEQKLGRIRYMEGNITDCDLGRLSADVAILAYVLQHLGSREQVLKALRNVYGCLKLGGRVVGANSCVLAGAPPETLCLYPKGSLTLPNGNSEWFEARATTLEPRFETTFYVQRWETIRELLAEAGFKGIRKLDAGVSDDVLSTISEAEAEGLRNVLTNVAIFCAEK